jgi:ABC-type Fe3+ transport system permease subunit
MSTHDAAGEADSSITDRSTSGRSRIGTLALVLTALSIVGFVILAVGSIAEWKGFSDDPDDNSAFADIVWTTFALGGILALVAGIVAWVRGRSRSSRGDVSAGQMAAGWVVLAIILSVIISALE